MHANYWPQWYAQLHPRNPPLSCVTLKPITTPRYLSPDIVVPKNPCPLCCHIQKYWCYICCCFNKIRQPFSAALRRLEGRRRRQKQTVRFIPLLLGLFCLLWAECVMWRREAGGERGSRKGVKNLIALISVLCGFGLSWGTEAVWFRTLVPAPLTRSLFSTENQFSWRPLLNPVFRRPQRPLVCDPAGLWTGMMWMSALIPALSGAPGSPHFIVPSAGLDRNIFAIIISCGVLSGPSPSAHPTPPE